MRSAAIGSMLLAACYSPSSVGTCAVTCNANSDCPNGLTCENRLCGLAGQPCGGGDAGSDGPITIGDAMPTGMPVCAGTVGGSPLGQICFDPEPPMVTLSGVVNTSSDPSCVATTVATFEVCILVTNSVGNTVRFTGTRPPVLWSASALTVSGEIDVSSIESNSATAIGASGNFADCGDPDDGNGLIDASTLGSGGAGGDFRGSGGAGGALNSTRGGIPQQSNLVGLRGGCPGFTGGRTAVERGGHGGGVAYLVAGTTIQITGKINASGGGGFAPLPLEGGSGGGSGGQISFDAPTVNIQSTAIVLALGGSGSSGSSDQLGGTAGKEPSFSGGFSAQGVGGPSGCISIFSGGGSRGPQGADGDPGDPGDTSTTTCAGAGGGGGDGLISIHGTTSPPTIDGAVFPTAFVPPS